MADIVVRCSECGDQVSVSEYIDPELATCPSCGGKLDLSKKKGKKPRKPKEKKAITVSNQADDNQSAIMPQTAKHRDTVTAAVAVSKRKKKKRRRMIVWAPNKWTLLGMYVAATAVLCFLRYTTILGEDVEALKLGGLCALGLAWVLVTLDAFQDNIMFGILCLAVPGYFIFHVFTQSDSFVLRLFTAVLILPFGIDAAKFGFEMMHKLIELTKQDHFTEDF